MKEFFRTLPWRITRKLSQISFYKKKAFAVVLTVIFSVLLVLTIGIRIFVPNTGSRMFSAGNSSFDFSDVDSSELEEMFGEMSDATGGSDDGSTDSDSDSDSSDMPSGDFSGDMPSGDFSGDFPEDFSGDVSGDFSGDASGFPDMSGDSDFSTDSADAEDSATAANGQTGIMGFLQGWRSHWLIFTILFAIADILCIVRLAILAHRKKIQLEEEAKQAREQMLAGEVVHTVHPVKKHKTNPAAVWAIPMVGVILLVAIVNAMTVRSAVSAAQTEATTYSGTAELASMDTVLPGSGTLEEEDAIEIELLSDVDISEWCVSDGDTVEEGDQLALVDSVSVMSAIATLQEQLDALDEDLAECEDEEISETIAAAADGRVMAIYAEEDTAVTDTMYTYSALMLISLDGYLCVSLESDADLSAGDSVVVTLSDDTTVDGKVSSVLSGTITVLVSDEEASPEESVSAATEDGEELGEGTLSIHSALSVTGYAGTVAEIEVSVGDAVESGDTLLTLTDTEYTGTYEQLLTQRSELEEAMQELFVLYQDPYIYATGDGVISDIVTVEENDISTSTSSGTGTLDGDSTSQTDISTYTNLIGVVTAVSEGVATISYLPDTYTITDYTDLSGIDLDTDLMTETGTLTAGSSYLMFTYTDSSFAIGTAADLAEGDTIVLAYNSEGTLVWIVCVDVTESSSGTDSSEGSSGSDSADSGTSGSSSGSGNSYGSGSGSDTSSTESTGNSTDSSLVSDAGSFGSMDAGSDSTDTDSLGIDSSLLESSGTDTGSDSSYSDSTSGLSSDLSTLVTDTTASSDSTSADDSELEASSSGSYSVSRTTAAAITPQDTMCITITVDELDILSLEIGQTAQVTLDAFPGQSFEGEVTSIDLSGTNSGGSTKFTAVVTIDREEDMLAGMNASASIVIDTTEEVLCIPEAALVEEDGTTCVYTTYDEETDTLGDPVEVTTGISDGENVEILSGLSEGDTYYYSYLDVVNYSTSSASSGSGSFSIDSLFSTGGGGGMSMP